MAPPVSTPAQGPDDPAAVRDLGAYLLERAPDLTDIWHRRLGKEAPELFERGGPVDDAARDLTEAVAICGVGEVREEFQAETRSSLATLVGAWRRAALPEHRLAESLSYLGDCMIEELVRLPPGAAEAAPRARAAACVLDATQILIRRAERTFRSWRDRSEADDVLSVAIFGEALGHEIRNRIHAAETALRLLRSPDDEAALAPEDRRRLHRLLLDAVVAARRAVYDVRIITSEDEGAHEAPVTASLHELVRRTVDQARVVAAETGIDIELPGPVPVVHVDARHVQVVLNNILGVAVRLLGACGGRTLRVSARHPSERAHVELSFVGDRRFLEEGHEQVLFEADLVDLAENGHHTRSDELGLWLTREAVEQMGGDLEVLDEESDTPGALTVRIPVAAPRDAPK